jgi:hypothetical protein
MSASFAVRPLCTALKKDGEPCRRTRKAGMELCASHAGTAHRPTKFTEEVRKRVIYALGRGVSRNDAAIYAGISPSALGNYIGYAHKAREANIPNEYVQFLHEIELAETKLKVKLIGNVIDGSGRDPRLGLDLAARKWPAEFAHKDQKLIEHSGDIEIEVLLGGRQPVDFPLQARERAIAVLEESIGDDAKHDE